MIELNYEVKNKNGNKVGFLQCGIFYSRFFAPSDENGELRLSVHANLNGEDIIIGKIETVIRDGKKDIEFKISNVDIKVMHKYYHDLISIENYLRAVYILDLIKEPVVE